MPIDQPACIAIDEAARQHYSTRTELDSIDDVTATFCMPPTTTCQGIRDTRSISCTTDDMCGVTGLVTGLDDGYCPTIGTGAGFSSYECGGALDCASAVSGPYRLNRVANEPSSYPLASRLPDQPSYH